MTKKEAIENHRKMWNWIADESLKRGKMVWKGDYFKEHGVDREDRPVNYCYCCQYDIEKGSSLLKNSACVNCPVVWPNEKYYAHSFCNKKGSLYNKAQLAFFELLDISLEEYAELVREIANLPEREE